KDDISEIKHPPNMIMTEQQKQLDNFLKKHKTLFSQQSAHNHLVENVIDYYSLEEQTLLRFLSSYNTNDLWETALSKVVYECQKAMKDKYCIRLLANSYYLDELLKIENGRAKWLEYVESNGLRSQTSPGDIRGNPEQIYQTRKISLHFLDGLTDKDYNNKFLPYTQTSLDFITWDMRNSFNASEDLAS
ncbi:15708_t:CDS:2, partial [Dentiscutata erythropus]